MDESVLIQREQEFLLTLYPPGTEILACKSYRPGYMPFPARVTVRTPDGRTNHCVLKVSETISRLERESRTLRVLVDLGLPVPRILAGPEVISVDSGSRAVFVMEELPGSPLPWGIHASLAEADLSCQLLIQGVLRLHHLTDLVKPQLGDILPAVTFSSELAQILERGGGWLESELFAEAVSLLQQSFTSGSTPLVFSNGDYNPLNFLHEGEMLTGWIDFEHACFEDPHIGFAKFFIWSTDAYGWGTGVKAGLVERYLYAQNLSRQEFAPRLVLRCLRHLQDEITANGAAATPNPHTVGLLQSAISDFR